MRKYIKLQPLALISFATALLWITPSEAANKALVIGIKEYGQWQSLTNTTNDAVEIGKKLELLGFAPTVIVQNEQPNALPNDPKIDPTNSVNLKAAIAKFTGDLQPDDKVIFFYSGHGASFSDQSGKSSTYLIPSDTPDVNITSKEVLVSSAISLADINVNFGNKLSVTTTSAPILLLIDACRTMVSEKGAGIGKAYPIISNEALAGKAEVIYATSHGQSAIDQLSNDDVDPNSVFARAVIKELARHNTSSKGYSTNNFFGKVSERVERLASNVKRKQIPEWSNATGLQKFQFVPCPAQEVCQISDSSDDKNIPKVPANYQVYINAVNGDASAQTKIGKLYLRGEEVDLDYSQALDWFKKAAEPKVAEQGNAEAQNALGEMYLEGLGMPYDYGQAFNWFQMSANQNHAVAQYNLGLMYLFGVDNVVEKKPTQAVEWLSKAANQNHAAAQYNLGLIYFDGEDGVDSNITQALDWYTKSAEQNFVGALISLGMIYLNGERGVDKDESAAKDWFLRAANVTENNSGDNSIALVNLGLMYQYGIGVLENNVEAARWYSKAAEKKDPEGQYLIGQMNEKGLGVPKDTNNAMAFYRKAANQNYSEAQYALAQLLEKGNEAYVNEAIRLYRKAAKTNNNALEADAKYALGGLLEKLEQKKAAPNFDEVRKLYTDASNQNNGDATTALGRMYEYGIGVKQNYNQAVVYYSSIANDTAFDSGNPHAQSALGRMYENGRGVTLNFTTAAQWYQKAAEQGSAEGQCALGRMYENGRGVTLNLAQAESLYRQAAEQNSAEGQYELGRIYLSGLGLLPDRTQAMRWFIKSAEQNFAKAQISLVPLYESDTNKDYVNAVKWYRKAAELGNAEGQYALGQAYMNGQGLESDYDNALVWYQKAADQGHANAQYALGRINDQSYDYEAAMGWYQQAAIQDHADAMCALGTLYISGIIGGIENYDEAETWYRKAADKNYACGQVQLGKMYEKGLKFNQNIQTALVWYCRAAAQGYLLAQGILLRLHATCN